MFQTTTLLTSLFSLLPFLTTTSALPTSNLAPRQAADLPVPRNAVYVQTFHNTDGSPLSILPLVQNPTGITHIILAALHIQSDAGDIHLNDDPPSSDVYAQLWQDVATIQQTTNVKVMAMLGGSAPGSFSVLENDDTVRAIPAPRHAVSLSFQLSANSSPIVRLVLRAPPLHNPTIQPRRSRPRH